MRACLLSLLPGALLVFGLTPSDAQQRVPAESFAVINGASGASNADVASAPGLPSAPKPATPALRAAFGGVSPQVPGPPPPNPPPLPGPVEPPPPGSTPLTRERAELLALRNNPRITASHLLALAAGQVTRETRSNELPQITGNMTAEKAEDGSRIGAGFLSTSRVYTHAGTGGSLSQLITDFGHTRELVSNSKLLEKAEQQNALATEQDVLLATDHAFYRLLNAQALLEVALATVEARQSVQNLTQALTRSALKSDLDLNIASADLSQSQLLQLDAENAVTSAAAALTALLAAPPETVYYAVESDGPVSAPPADAMALTRDAEEHRPDLKALQFNTQAEHALARAQQLQSLPTISALATGGLTPVRPDGGVFPENWWGAAGVNVSLPLFTGSRISAQTKEAELRARADERQASNLSNEIARDVRVATLAAQTAFQRIGVAESFQKETAQALSLAQTRYKLGLSSIVELSQAQLQSTQASVTAVNARFDYLLALRSLDYARGQLAP